MAELSTSAVHSTARKGTGIIDSWDQNSRCVGRRHGEL